jgi:hypothetical protein
MELEEIGNQLTAAAETGDFERAIALADRYRGRFDEIWAARHESGLPEQALLLHRTTKAAELRGVKLAKPYRRPSPAPGEWHMTL